MPERDGYIPGVPCWVDTSHPDPEAAARFYGGRPDRQQDDRLGTQGNDDGQGEAGGPQQAGAPGRGEAESGRVTGRQPGQRRERGGE